MRILLLVLICSFSASLSSGFTCSKHFRTWTASKCPITCQAWGDSLESSCLALQRIKNRLVCKGDHGHQLDMERRILSRNGLIALVTQWLHFDCTDHPSDHLCFQMPRGSWCSLGTCEFMPWQLQVLKVIKCNQIPWKTPQLRKMSDFAKSAVWAPEHR